MDADPMRDLGANSHKLPGVTASDVHSTMRLVNAGRRPGPDCVIADDDRLAHHMAPKGPAHRTSSLLRIRVDDLMIPGVVHSGATHPPHVVNWTNP